MKTKNQFIFKTLKTFLKHLVVPEGFVLSVKEDTNGQKYTEVTLTKTGDIQIILECQRRLPVYGRSRTQKVKYIHFAGHTNFTEMGNETGNNIDYGNTFDRYGVSDSFYSDSETDVNEQIKEEIQKVYEYRAKMVDYIDVPTIGFRIHKDKVSVIRDAIETGKGYSFSPRGFGTGYYLSQRQQWGYDKRNLELEEFFGTSPIFVSSRDCD